MPSCMRAPPLAEKMISGRARRTAYSMPSVSFSPTAALMLPIMNRLSSTQATHLRPPISPVATMTASSRPVFSCAARSLSS